MRNSFEERTGTAGAPFHPTLKLSSILLGELDSSSHEAPCLAPLIYPQSGATLNFEPALLNPGPVAIHVGLDFGDEGVVAFGVEEVGEAPLFFQVFLHRQAAFGDSGVHHLAVHILL